MLEVVGSDRGVVRAVSAQQHPLVSSGMGSHHPALFTPAGAAHLRKNFSRVRMDINSFHAYFFFFQSIVVLISLIFITNSEIAWVLFTKDLF